jgi:hypothetical protein
MFMKGDIAKLNHLKEILSSFAEASELNVSFDKSIMVPINVLDDRLDVLASSFGCSKGTLPFTCLGLSLSLANPTVADFLPLVNKCERRLVAFSSYMSEIRTYKSSAYNATNICYVQFLFAKNCDQVD